MEYTNGPLSENGFAFQNLPGVTFSDAVMITNPSMFIQDMQELVSSRKEVQGNLPNTVYFCYDTKIISLSYASQ